MSYWNGKRVLVTGGGGFLGRHLVAKLRDLPCERIVVARRRDFDLTREDDARRLFEEDRIDVLFHLAGMVGGIGANKERPAEFYYHNILMNTHAIEQARRSGVEKIIASGAGCGYPEHASLPLEESSFWDGFPQRESAPYSLAKRMLHVQTQAYWDQYKLPIILTVPGNIYGPYDNFDLEHAHVVPALVRKFVEAEISGADRIAMWGSGAPTRDFVYAGDVATGMVRAAEVLNEPAMINLASGRETSIREVVDALASITGFSGRIVNCADRPDGQSRRVFDVSRARELLGWSSITSLAAGLETTVDWYRKNRETARNFDRNERSLAVAL